jgi:FkbM family methyltransferase
MIPYRKLRIFCENWVSVILRHLFRRPPPVEIVLRNGVRVPGTNGHHIWALMDLLAAGWTIRWDDRENLFVLSSAKERVELRFRRDRLFASPVVEIYLKHVYGDSFPNQTVVDIGMGTGDSSIFFARRGASRVIGVEPFPSSFEMARINIHANGLDGVVIPVNVAVSSRAGGTELFTTSKSQTEWAVSGPGAPPPRPVFDSKITVPTTTFDSLVSDYRLGAIDCVKFDCEGCEYDVVRTVNALVLHRVRAIKMEYHAGLQDLPALLQQSGFEVRAQGHPVGYLYAQRGSPSEPAQSPASP